jgi:hypothetical protein
LVTTSWACQHRRPGRPRDASSRAATSRNPLRVLTSRPRSRLASRSSPPALAVAPDGTWLASATPRHRRRAPPPRPRPRP